MALPDQLAPKEKLALLDRKVKLGLAARQERREAMGLRAQLARQDQEAAAAPLVPPVPLAQMAPTELLDQAVLLDRKE